MSMITLTFENFLCRDCGFLSPVLVEKLQHSGTTP